MFVALLFLGREFARDFCGKFFRLRFFTCAKGNDFFGGVEFGNGRYGVGDYRRMFERAAHGTRFAVFQLSCQKSRAVDDLQACQFNLRGCQIFFGNGNFFLSRRQICLEL